MNNLIAKWCQQRQWQLISELGRRCWQVRDNGAGRDYVVKVAHSEKERLFLNNQLQWQTQVSDVSGISSGSIHSFEGAELLINNFQRGETLANFIRQQWLNTPNRDQLAAKLCGLFIQLERLHSRGCIHGDLTPSNILCAGETVILLDFANARAVASDDSLRPFFSYTQHYSHPLQRKGKGSAATEFDWYSFFCIIEIAFTGKPIAPNWQQKNPLEAIFDDNIEKLLSAKTCQIDAQRIYQLAKAVASLGY